MHTNEMGVFGVSPAEEQLYRHFLRNPDSPSEGVHVKLGVDRHETEEAMARLIRLRLLRPGDRPGWFIPVDPEQVVARLTEMRLREMYQEIQRLTQSRYVLTTLRAETAATAEGGGQAGAYGGEHGVEEIDDRDALSNRMEELVFFAREEIASVEPGFHLMSEAVLKRRAVEWRALKRGVRRRLVLPADTLRHPRVAGHVRELLARGGEVRVVEEISDQLAVYDGRVALMPKDPKNLDEGALLVRGRGLVSTLSGLFEKVWEQAEDVSVELREPAEPEPELSEAELRVLRMMCEVGKDETGARDLGVSVRTYRRHIADVLRILGASTRAQAALLARERGWV
ncbi:helix-turn-helix transcriptional regulator [Streptomyces sp. CMB-StM0423]|uniref:helix-turn-helix transcriptional regulator n=1 Tax=Streptomyces sp. CMB-StM0423 TaxID=2059884 RepID=UPI001F39C87D|nr:helix-turn-helix transcriptional regulator [Streptomyces sp. CMB-StM0423]